MTTRPNHEPRVHVEIDVEVLPMPLTGKGRFVGIPWEPGTARSPITGSAMSSALGIRLCVHIRTG